MEMMEEVHTETGDLKDQLCVVSVCVPVLPHPLVMHVPKMDYIPGNKK